MGLSLDASGMCVGGAMSRLTEQNHPMGMLLCAPWAGWSLGQALSPCLPDGGTCPLPTYSLVVGNATVGQG